MRAQAAGIKSEGKAFQIVNGYKRPTFYAPSMSEKGYLRRIV